MRLSSKVSLLIFVITASILLFLSYLFYIQIGDLASSYRWVNHSNIVMLRLERTISYLKDAETGQRGFLLTNDSVFLGPYRDSYKKIQTEIDRVKVLIADNPEQQKNINALQDLINERYRKLDTVIKIYNRPQTTAAARNEYLLKGKALMDSMRRQVALMDGIETQLLQKRIKERDRHIILTPLLGILLIATALIVLIAFYYSITRELKRSKLYLEQMQNLNTQLQQKNRQLEITNEELDSFNYVASHDLKEPLRKIQTFSSLLLDKEHQRLSDNGKHYLQRLQYATKRMQNLLEDLLAYTHINRNSKSENYIDLNKLLQEVLLNMKETIEENNGHIEVDHLPAVKGVPFQLRQLFENLISNSLKYKQQDIPPHIHIKGVRINKNDMPESFAAKADFYCHIVYKDNGIGFNQAYAYKIFELFERLHPSDRRPGTGIGLTICKKIVQNHEGFITVQSQENKGTTFEIYLPVGEE